jgi:hypothetical protein
MGDSHIYGGHKAKCVKQGIMVVIIASREQETLEFLQTVSMRLNWRGVSRLKPQSQPHYLPAFMVLFDAFGFMCICVI